jgi:hypothetical protein
MTNHHRGRNFSLNLSRSRSRSRFPFSHSHSTGSPSAAFSSSFAASSSPHLTSSSFSLYLLVLLSRTLCRTGVNASSVAMATLAYANVDLFPFRLIFPAPHFLPRALLALHDNALPVVSIPRPLPPFCVPPPFLSSTPRSCLSDRHCY